MASNIDCNEFELTDEQFKWLLSGFDVNTLPDDPKQLKQMLLELQSVITKKDEGLNEKNAIYQELLERYNIKRANEYGKKLEKMPGADEVFNEAEVTLDEQDEQLLASVSTTEIRGNNSTVSIFLSRIEANYNKLLFHLTLFR